MTVNLGKESEGACLCKYLNSVEFVDNTETKHFCYIIMFCA